MDTFATLDEIADNIKTRLSGNYEKKKIALLYAFNGVGKTRLSTIIHIGEEGDGDENSIEVLRYNAFFEDLFTWDNEARVIDIDSNSPIIAFIRDQGLDKEITDNFQKLTRSKIFPTYDFASWQITFSFSPGDDRGEDNIKISRGEENLFIWSVFYTVLESAIQLLEEKKEDRSSKLFDNLKFVIVDDPVSSIDDTKIIMKAIELIRIIDSTKHNHIGFFIATHHALFYNVLWNKFRGKADCKFSPLLLSKNDNEFILREQKDDSPFSYHLAIKNEIQSAINNKRFEKYHFNLFRGLLEKTANFLGLKNWKDCLDAKEKDEIARILNLYSHGKLSELESREYPEEHKELFVGAFDNFIKKYHWSHE